MTTHDIPALLASLRARLDALGSFNDCRSEAEKTVWTKAYGSISSTISQLADGVDPKIEERLQFWQTKRAEWLDKESELETSLRDQPGMKNCDGR